MKSFFHFRVELGDLLGAISYALRVEVSLKHAITGSTYSSLYNFIVLLEQVKTDWMCVGVRNNNPRNLKVL